MAKDLNKESGRRGEEIAAKYLRDHGYNIIEKNYRTRFGEIDLIATCGDRLIFIEVKLKIGDKFGTPEEMITKGKVWQVRKTAEGYLLENPQTKQKFAKYQIVAVCVVTGGGDSVDRISHYENIESDI
ncbi:hypothetical protein A3H21_00950 [Candidatus Woesebacteria bacterium RIFCSPLOWO2_12_FULL_42_8]|nr:MAG: hypothetical protein A3H21_00950 [Candidatus Woesebacteria bacterium RIFCSPLOWO2_12_FULL_42_8]